MIVNDEWEIVEREEQWPNLRLCQYLEGEIMRTTEDSLCAAWIYWVSVVCLMSCDIVSYSNHTVSYI